MVRFHLLRDIIKCPRGLMDKASVSEAEDCGFESRRGYQFLKMFFCSNSRHSKLKKKKKYGLGWDSNPHLCALCCVAMIVCEIKLRASRSLVKFIFIQFQFIELMKNLWGTAKAADAISISLRYRAVGRCPRSEQDSNLQPRELPPTAVYLSLLVSYARNVENS